jgi:hypothetical protein
MRGSPAHISANGVRVLILILILIFFFSFRETALPALFTSIPPKNSPHVHFHFTHFFFLFFLFPLCCSVHQLTTEAAEMALRVRTEAAKGDSLSAALAKERSRLERAYGEVEAARAEINREREAAAAKAEAQLLRGRVFFLGTF